MSTSLKEQLNRLAVPQTSVLNDARRKASLIFDSKEAATKDRKTIYELGISGLQELIAMNSAFQQFEATLFDESTLQMERSVELSEVNKLLDKNIRKFLQHLSPYFMLRPAHLCIEWLLRRFELHQYNKQMFLALMLPYHETNIFVKCLQTIRIIKSDLEFNWLKPLQKPGKALSKTAIINRAATNPAFLAFICQSTMDSVKEMGSRAHLLQAQINFYASIVAGALDSAHAVEEWHIVTILPSLLKALSSNIVDFTSAAYIIVSQLVARTQLSLKMLNALISKVAAVQFEQLRTAATLLLIWIFDTQAEMHPLFTDNMLSTLVQHKWLTGIISTLAKEGVAVHFLCVPIIQSAVQAIQREDDKDNLFKVFLERLLYDVEFPNATASEIINSFLDSYVAPSSTTNNKSSKINASNDIIELDSDDDMGETASEGFQSWYSDYLKKLERQYPNAFDKTIKDALKLNVDESSNRSKAVKMALRYRLKTFDADSTNVYENLYHHTAKIRIFAIQTLIANLSNYQSKPQNYQLLKECLADRILDDSELVVAEVLKLPTKEFIDILGHSQFVQALFGILCKAQGVDNKDTNWSKLTLPVVQHLTAQDIVDHYDSNLILLDLMPLLFPTVSSQEVYNSIKIILKSPLTEKVAFLKELKQPENKNSGEFSASEFKRNFLDIISHSKNTPSFMTLFQSVQAQNDINYFKQATHFAHFLLLVTACLKQPLSGTEALFVFTVISNYSKQFTLKHMEIQEWQLLNKRNFIPLQLFSDFLSALTLHTTFKELHDWEQPSKELECCLKILELLCREAFTHEQAQEKLEWSNTLKQFLNSVFFKKNQDKLEFFFNFYSYDELTLVDSYAELRLRAFKLLNSMLLNKKNKFTLTTTNVFKVLVSLNSQHETVRLQGMETLKCMGSIATMEAPLQYFVEQVLQRHEEISMDHEQFPLVLYTILRPMQKRDGRTSQMSTLLLSQIMKALRVQKQEELKEITFKAELLQMLKHLNDEQLLSDMVPLALNVLKKYTSSQTAADEIKLMEAPFSNIYQLICERFDSHTIDNVLVDNPEAWQLFVQIFSRYDLFLVQQGNLVPVPCVLLSAIDELAFEKMSPKYQLGFIKLIINCIAQAENDSILLAANKLLRRCLLDCKPFVTILEAMCKKSVSGGVAVKTTQRKSAAALAAIQQPQLQLQSSDWREGVVLLELLENKKKLLNAESLVPALFELLKLCLDVEEQSSVEYVKQLILSALLHCCQQAKLDGINLQKALPKSTFRIDQIVQCVRGTQNPQTHHNALLLLAHCAALFPQEVLLNIVDIFTFMGSSVVRHDDAFSFHLINNIIDSLLPILVGSKSQQGIGAVVPVLKVFSDIMLDVPEHRRPALYTKLLNTLDAEQHLWMFLCVVFEMHVIDDEKQRLLQKKRTSNERNAAEKLSKRLKIALNLTNSFPPHIALQTCIELMHYIKHLPHCQETVQTKPSPKVECAETALFDVNVRTAKQLRHYKYVIMQFLSTFTSSAEFLQQISLLSEEEVLALKPYYQSFIIKILSYVPLVTTAIDKSDDSAQTKFWKVILHHLHDVLDNVISLLSPNMFLVVVHGLMQHQLFSIRKKVIELLISKLQKRDTYFDACEDAHLKNLLKPLSEIVESIAQKGETTATNETYFMQQTALIAIKLLSKLFALRYIDDFKGVLLNLTKITKKRRQVSKIVFATVILTLVEITSNLKAHSLSQLPKFMPQLIEVLSDQVEFVRQNGTDNVTLAIITGILKLFESLPLFLGPYITDIIFTLSSLNKRIDKHLAKQAKDQRSTMALQKINLIWVKIANDVPARILVPSCEKAYNKMFSSHNYADIGVLMKLLLTSITNTKTKDIFTVQEELCKFFMAAIEFRSQLAGVRNFDMAKISATESCILDAFVAWVLKLSESSFRPIYMRLYDWALKKEASTEQNLTFFLLTHKIADALKSLFVLFAVDVIQDAADLLEKHNSAKFSIDQETEPLSSELLKSLFNTLYNVFLYDSKGFINPQRFQILIQPIVDQLENRLVLENEELQRILMSCIAQLAVATSSDIMWKQLNQQVLLKTRTNVPEVRILSFNCCVEIARKLGEDFSTLLPETVPFVAELFEDENPRVEQNTRKSVQELEVILGESLQKYL